MQIKSFEDLEKRPWEKDDVVVKKEKREDVKVVITSGNKDDSDFSMWDFELEKWVNANTTTVPSYKVPDDFFHSASTMSNNTGGEPLDLKTLNDAIQSLYNTGGVQSRPNNPSEVMLPGDRKYQLDEEGDIFFVEGKGLFCHNKLAGYDPCNSTYRCSICLKTYTSGECCPGFVL